MLRPGTCNIDSMAHYTKARLYIYARYIYARLHGSLYTIKARLYICKTPWLTTLRLGYIYMQDIYMQDSMAHYTKARLCARLHGLLHSLLLAFPTQ